MNDVKEKPIVLGVDPGRCKCGLAAVQAGALQPLEHCIVPRAEVVATVRLLLQRWPVAMIAIGGGTGSARLAAELADCPAPNCIVDERNTTLAARGRYFAAYPPRGWRRLLPAGLRLPPVPLDDWAAVLIAERYLASLAVLPRL